VILFNTSVIIDARDPGSPLHSWAKEQLAEAIAGDGAGVNTVVISEASVQAISPERIPELLQKLGIVLLPLPISSAIPRSQGVRHLFGSAQS
jgi:predicted nucleic acid-binding protein